MPNLLIEIGTEELPLASLDMIYSELASKFKGVLDTYRLVFQDILVEATPRRIALFVSALASRQTDKIVEITGPSLEKAYDSDGRPTAALQGFLKSKEVSAKDAKVKETPKGKFVVVQKKEIGKPAASVLNTVFHEILSALNFPKTMRWESTGMRFPRPVRWLVVLLGDKVIRLQLADVKSGNQSFGHRFLSPKPFVLRRADWKVYEHSLKRAHVILSLRAREEMIRKALQGRFHQRHYDEDLIHTTAQLVEEPFLMEGNFSKTYLELPAEVLASCMKKNQKIFACYDAKGHLTGRFVAVLNGKRSGLSKIRAGYENVLDARLRDARYFFEADSKEPLEKKLPLLEQIVYLGRLGNMREKTDRLEKLAEAFASFVG
ncbi:MAG: glycine--tRNA ligase subunit beta, partial [Candidatus Omnitrophica bacterium]|nr:glycine--tRNA ligase subunit beta [Candidatus Omnitrophota bacterium]